jgi:predicted nucleic acid-binding protein
MTGCFLDSNIFLRHILDDDPVQSPACRQVFHAIEAQEMSAWTTSLVVSEIVFVLSNPVTFALTRPALKDRILPLIQLNRLKLERKQLYPRIFDLFVKYPIDYVDAYHVALLERDREALGPMTYDKDFDRVPTMRFRRREPRLTDPQGEIAHA